MKHHLQNSLKISVWCPYPFWILTVKFTRCFQRNCLRILLGTRLTDRISNSRLNEKCGSIPLSRAIMKERLRWLGHVLQTKDERLLKIVLFGQPSRAKRKAGHPRLGWEDVIKKDLKEMGTSLEGLKREALNTLEWKRSVSSCVCLGRVGVAVRC